MGLGLGRGFQSARVGQQEKMGAEAPFKQIVGAVVWAWGPNPAQVNDRQHVQKGRVLQMLPSSSRRRDSLLLQLPRRELAMDSRLPILDNVK